jgi:hypothetical protein
VRDHARGGALVHECSFAFANGIQEIQCHLCVKIQRLQRLVPGVVVSSVDW